MDSVFLDLTVEQWIETGISGLIVLAVLIIGRWIVKIVLVLAVRRAKGQLRTFLEDLVMEAVRMPLYWLAVMAALDFSLGRLDFLPISQDSSRGNIFFIIYTLITFMLIWRFIVRFAGWYVKVIAPRTETDTDEHLAPFLRRIALIVVSIILLIILLDRFNVDVSGLVTTLGITSLAIALAAQATLSDAISGFVIMIDQPYRIGDRIDIQDLNTWGDVVDVGLRSTRVRTRDNRMVIVPNSVIAKSLVVNYSYPDSTYRTQVNIGVAYGSDIEQARQIMIDTVRQVEGVMKDQRVEALLLEFGDSALIFRLRWWIDSYVDTRRMFDSVNTAVYNALEKAKIDLPFPQRVLHHKIDNDDAQRLSNLLRDQ